ncbi:MAG: NADP-specific glutamate dehydrogenase [Lachnospiraceae bacterium]|nr:NADP-specific glutamate dehydrogenase [Lachnospiraceae bacterium]
MNSYVEKVISETKKKYPCQPEFLQTVEEVLTSLEPAFDKHPEYEANALLERLVEPEREIKFRVVWSDDQGKPHVNNGYRVQFNSAIGPYKGGLRFHPSVNLSIIKFLGFEQTFKNSLTGLPMGGGKGGADFDPKGKSDGEIMRFCQAFMTELYRHIGPKVDVPAGDLGVGGTEIGYMFGQYKRIRNAYENGVLTGKGLSYGGSLIRPEATGFGAVYFFNEVLKHEGKDIKGMRFALSGFGNVAWGAAKKLTELGATVVSISGPDGYVALNGMTDEMIDFMLEMRASRRDCCKDFSDKFGVPFFAGKKPWGNVDADVYMPCACQNEITLPDAEAIVTKGVHYVNEVSNMPTTNEAMAYLRDHGVLLAPSKAVNAGGVSVSGLEMTQNSERLSWTAEQVDDMLKSIMKGIHTSIVDACNAYGVGYDLVAGANLAGFKKVAEAMMAQGWV